MPEAPVSEIVKLKYMDTDPGHALPGAKTLMQGWEYKPAEPLLDGPVSRRVAVIDFDPETGRVMPGARFVAPKGKSPGRYEVKDENDYEAEDFKQVSVFSAVLRMMSIFETPDVLGRDLTWAFDGAQLLVVPRAGKMANAFYHRASRSLQFFFVDDPDAPGKLVYTCLSPDIVAHETTHAILDGIAPDLYNASSPQSLAMHEAVADLGAVMLAVRTKRLSEQVLNETKGDIRKAEAFNTIAQQFGAALYGPGRPLRDLNNDVQMPDPGDSARTEPHELSTVLTGALYALLVNEFEGEVDAQIAALPAGSAKPTEAEKTEMRRAASGKALFQASEKFKRIAFRALDYLPPGEIAFADYGRAMVAADIFSNPEDHEPRDFIKAEFKRRGIIDKAKALDPVDPRLILPDDLDLDLLIRSDWAAYRFADEWRAKLWIPPAIPFEVRPRLDVTRKTWRKGGKEALTRAILMKVGWQDVQNRGDGEFFFQVAVQRGTTLAIDADTGAVSALLTTNPGHPSQKDRSTTRNDEMRTTYLKASIAEGQLELSSPDVQIQEGVLRVKGLGQMLHMMGH